MEKLRIAVLSALVYPPGTEGYRGLERVAYLLAKGLRELGHDVVLYCAGPVEIHDVEVVELARATEGDVQAGVELEKKVYTAELARELRNFDLVIDNTWTHPYYLQLDNVLIVHHAPDPPSHVVFYAWSKLVALSRAHVARIEQVYGVRVPFIYHGIDVEAYPFSRRKEDYVLFIGRVSPEKGALTFAQLCEKYRIRGIIAGEDVDVPDKHYVLRVMRACRHYCEYWGRVDEKEKRELMAKARAVICLSSYEMPWLDVFNIACIEAFACGTPVIAYVGSGAPAEYTMKNITGYVFTVLDEVPNLVDQCTNLWPDLIRKIAQTVFHYRRMANDYILTAKNIFASCRKRGEQ